MYKYRDYENEYNLELSLCLDPPILIEQGIILKDNTLITSGRILEIVKECKRLVDNREWGAFRGLMNEDLYAQFDDDAQTILRQCVITKRGGCILDLLCHST